VVVRRLVAVFAAVATVCCASASGNLGRSSALVTLAGVDGVTPHMSLAQVDRVWRMRLQVVSPAGGSAAQGFAAICVGRIEGAADFYGLGVPTTLRALWFFAGVRTSAGIRIGSSIEALRHAYGSLLTPAFAAYGRAFELVRRGPAPRPTIEFQLDPPAPGHRPAVTSIGFGYKLDLDPDLIDGVTC
jgi:hypothetical protein